MAKKQSVGLGRGIGALIPDLGDFEQSTTQVTTSITTIPIEKIETNPYQPRREFDEVALEELAQSIRQQGVITPITVRKMANGNYQLIAGERRFRASKMAELKEIPAYIRVATDGQMMEMALVENIQREQLNAMEIALSYNALIEECQLTHEQLSEKVGKNRTTITNYLRLLNLPAETQIALNKGEISMAHARCLLNVNDTETHIKLLREIIDRHLSVHQTEALVKNGSKPVKPKIAKEKDELPEFHSQARLKMKEQFQSEVEIRRSRRGKGTLTIHFNNDADFERVLKILSK